MVVFALLVVLSCVMLVVSWLERRWNLPSLKMIPTMCGMCVGWAVGNASVRLLRQLDGSTDEERRFCVSCNWINLGYAVGLTVATALLILWLRPCMRFAEAVRGYGVGGVNAGRVHRSGLPTPTRLERAKAIAFAWGALCIDLVSQGIRYNVMFVWGYTCRHLITWGVSSDQRETPLYSRTLVLWAATVTVVGSLLTVKTSKWRAWLGRRQAYVRKELLREAPVGALRTASSLSASEPNTPLRIGDGVEAAARSIPQAAAPAGMTPLGLFASPTPVHEIAEVPISIAATPLGTRRRSFAHTLARIDRKLGRRVWLVQILVLIESTLAWVAGVAWTEAVEVMTTQADYPTASVVVWDSLLALGFAVSASLWFIVTGQKTTIDESRKTSREAVERYYLMYALSFIVGWSIIIVLRDIETLFADAVSHGGRYGERELWGEGLLVFIFGPGLTFLLVKTKHASFSTMCCSPTALQPLMRQHEANAGEASTPSIDRGHAPLAEAEADEQLSGSVRQMLAHLRSVEGSSVASTSSDGPSVAARGGSPGLQHSGLSQELLGSPIEPVRA